MAACSEASPGLAIGVGGSPLLSRVLYGLGSLSWADRRRQVRMGEPQVVGLGGVGPERHAGVQAVVEDAGHRPPVRGQLGLALDDGRHGDHLVGAQVQAGCGRAQAYLAGLVVELADHLLQHVHLGLPLLHLVGVGEEQPLEVIDPGGLVGAAHFAARGCGQKTRCRQVQVRQGRHRRRDLADGVALRDPERVGDQLGAGLQGGDGRVVAGVAREGVAARQQRPVAFDPDVQGEEGGVVDDARLGQDAADVGRRRAPQGYGRRRRARGVRPG